MIKALFTSATGMNAQQLVVDNTANNLANVNTTGFKRSQMDFQDLIYVTQRAPGTEAAAGLQIPNGLQIGSGVRVSGNTKIFSEGVLEPTNNPLDLAIQGDGFFRIVLPSGQLNYTRDGSFKKNSTGDLVTSGGFLLDPKITIPTDAVSVTIGTDGTVSALVGANTTKPTVLGKITLTRFSNPAGLQSEGSNLFSETAASGSPKEVTPGLEGAGSLLEGHLERSNVEVVQELVSLIQAQRAYEINSRAIRVADEMLSDANNIVR